MWPTLFGYLLVAACCYWELYLDAKARHARWFPWFNAACCLFFPLVGALFLGYALSDWFKEKFINGRRP